MGILVRQVTDRWVIELREDWYFREGDASFRQFKKFAEDHKLAFAVDNAPNGWFRVTMMNSSCSFSTPAAMLILFEELFRFKVHHGDARLPMGKVPDAAPKPVLEKPKRKVIVKKTVVGRPKRKVR